MSSRLGVFFALALASADAVAAPSLWEDVAHPHHRRCAQLLDDAVKLRGAGEIQAALQAVRKAVTLCASDREVLQLAGETLLGLHEFAEGRQRLERARALADGAPATRERELALAFHLGFAREVTGDLEGAIEEHRRLESMGGLPAPNQYLVHYDLGDELMAVGRLREAIDEYRRAVTLAADKPVVRLALAVALDRDEQLDQAEAELNVAVTLDPQLRRLGSEEYVFIPAADVHYYRALALVERGSLAEARLALRTFLAELPAGPYAAQARRRLADAEARVDARELEVAGTGGVDTRALARALGPSIAALEGCLPAERIVRVRLLVSATGVLAEPHHPAAECLNHVLSHPDMTSLGRRSTGSVIVPMAGRRAAASVP